MSFLKNYSINLAKEQAQCEANFIAMQRLLGEAELGKTRYFDVALPNRPLHYAVSFEVLERSTHTALVAVSADQYLSRWLHDMDFEVSIYFDAAMAEVVKFNGQRRLKIFVGDKSRCYGDDEKRQINEFLAEWLAHCLAYGISRDSPFDTSNNSYVTNC